MRGSFIRRMAKQRCPWPTDELYCEYHDLEWGVPHHDERWFPGVDRMLEISRANCLRTYVWAGGNWSPGYKLSLAPLGGIDRLLTTYFARILGQPRR